MIVPAAKCSYFCARKGVVDTEAKEKIKVYIDIQNGKTICVCHYSRKKCGKHCATDTLERDKFAGWEKTMRRDRYGKSKL